MEDNTSKEEAFEEDKQENANSSEASEVPNPDEIIERWENLSQEEQNEVLKTIGASGPNGFVKFIEELDEERLGDLAEELINRWQKSQFYDYLKFRSTIWLVGGIIIVFFGGLSYLTYAEIVPGGTLIFFAGTVLGYIVKIGAEIG